MVIYFNTSFDDSHIPLTELPHFGVEYYGPQKLVNYLSILLGLPKPASGVEYLRLEQYRQTLKSFASEFKEPLFYEASFNADQFAVAADLLRKRDELILSGWDFQIQEEIPPRIKVLAKIEQYYRDSIRKVNRQFWTYEERFAHILNHLNDYPTNIEVIYLAEPRDLLPTPLFRLFQVLEEMKVSIISFEKAVSPNLSTDLGRFQNNLVKPKPSSRSTFQADGSLLVLNSANEASLGVYIAQLMRKNPAYRPAILLGSKCNTLDNAFIQEGLPALGIETSSYAKPSLQVLKLVTIFLWRPIDPYKLLEFVSLQIKPLPYDLANRIAIQIAQQPGIKGDRWYAMIAEYFKELEETEFAEIKEARYQYNFWFERDRYSMEEGAPKQEVVEIFEFLENWAINYYRDGGEIDANILNLSIQAGNIKELLSVTPEEQLSKIEIERVVRTINEPGYSRLKERQLGAVHAINQPDAILNPVDQLVWWNFINADPTYFFSKWYAEEIEYFTSYGIRIDSPTKENQLLNWKNKQPFLKTKDRLILCLPNKHNGQAVEPHPCFGNLQASFENFYSFNIDTIEGRKKLETHFVQPSTVAISVKPIQKIQPFIHSKTNIDLLNEERIETPTSLENLFYYPYKWFFRYYCKIRPSSIQSIVEHSTLFGNLAHRFLEKLLMEDHEDWTKIEVEHWIEEQARSLFQQEGSILLMYGNEAERVNFINRVKFAAWSMISLIRNNNWKVIATEKPLNGYFSGIKVKGRADLLLGRGDEQLIIDLKWKGSTYRKKLLKNEEDLQLVLYANLITQESDSWPRTAFYIMERATVLARSDQAFTEVEMTPAVGTEEEVQERIYRKMEKTLDWRKKQLEEGLIEIRRKETVDLLEEKYEGQNLLELLEMKDSNAPFDDYFVLIGAVK